MSGTPYYKNTADALREVGISARQLSYWRKEGLVDLELGDGKRYTEGDIRQLKFLRRLIDEYGLSTKTVRRLLTSVGPRFDSYQLSRFRFMNLSTGKLVGATEALETLWNEFGATETDEHLDEYLYTLALLIFGRYQRRMDFYSNSERSASVYAAYRDTLLKEVREMDYVARVTVETRDPELRELLERAQQAKRGDLLQRVLESPGVDLALRPSLPGDPEFTLDELKGFAKHQFFRLRGFREFVDELPFGDV